MIRSTVSQQPATGAGALVPDAAYARASRAGVVLLAALSTVAAALYLFAVLILRYA